MTKSADLKLFGLVKLYISRLELGKDMTQTNYAQCKLVKHGKMLPVHPAGHL